MWMEDGGLELRVSGATSDLVGGGWVWCAVMVGGAERVLLGGGLEVSEVSACAAVQRFLREEFGLSVCRAAEVFPVPVV